MKVLHLPLWAPNKDDVQLGNFIQQHIDLSNQDHDTHSIEFFSDASLKGVIIIDEGDKTRINYPKSWLKWRTLYWYLKACKLVHAHLNKKGFEPDLIHCHVAGRNLWFASKYFRKTPYLLSEHWSGYLNGHFDRLPFYFKRFLILKMNRAKVITCVSSHLAESLIEIGVNKRIEILQNVIQYKEKTKGNISDCFTFLVVADLVDEVKNISGVIEAFSSLKIESSEMKMVIVGGGKDQEYLERLVNDKNLSSQVVFHGRCIQKVVQEHFLKADCVIVNSHVETYSMVTIESILSGCPVIATRCGGPEQFINADNGILINTNDTSGLKDAMLKMIRNEATYMPDKVRSSIVNVYSEKAVKNHLDQIYRQAIQ
jgi:glycosyltransferase involved in cell wall biosynthesis